MRSDNEVKHWFFEFNLYQFDLLTSISWNVEHNDGKIVFMDIQAVIQLVCLKIATSLIDPTIMTTLEFYISNILHIYDDDKDNIYKNMSVPKICLFL